MLSGARVTKGSTVTTQDDIGIRETVTEVAKAVGEVSRAGHQALVVTEKLGSFLSRIVGQPLEQVSGIVTDKLKYVRLERSLRLVDRAQGLIDQRGNRMVPRQVPLNVAIPVLEGASLEEDDSLQDVWAALLVNAADANSGVEVKRALVSILQDFSPMEVRLLQAIYDAPMQGVPTKGLPDAYVEPGKEESDPGLPAEPVQIGLWQLKRLGCITEAGTFDSVGGVRRVQTTALGKAMVKACSATPMKSVDRPASSK